MTETARQRLVNAYGDSGYSGALRSMTVDDISDGGSNLEERLAHVYSSIGHLTGNEPILHERKFR